MFSLLPIDPMMKLAIGVCVFFTVDFGLGMCEKEVLIWQRKFPIIDQMESKLILAHTDSVLYLYILGGQQVEPEDDTDEAQDCSFFRYRLGQ